MTTRDDQRSKRRQTLALLSAAAGTLVTGLPLAAHAQAQAQSGGKGELRIGYQKYGTLIILKGRGTLEKRLANEGISVKWSEFTAGPVLLEGLNVGSIDFGTTGEAPPIFAQAAGADLVYIANEPPAPSAEAIVVPASSPITSLAGLKGKKVAFNKGSNAHYLLVKALEKAGLKYTDIQPVTLAPADARAAFERGSVDAWSIWDPFLAAAEKQINARVLANGENIVSNHQFYLASRSYAQKNPQILRILIEELAKVDEWGGKNHAEVAALLGPLTGLSPEVTELAARRLPYGVRPVSKEVIAEQQRIADTFAELKLIPKKIEVSRALLANPA